MQAGKLRYPVNIEKYTWRQDPMTGELIEEWVPISREWADIESISGKEFMAAQSLRSETVYRIKLRYREDLDTTWRIREGQNLYAITAILPDSRRRILEVMCKIGN